MSQVWPVSCGDSRLGCPVERSSTGIARRRPSTTRAFMTENRIKSAPVAYENQPFLNSPDGRILRILSEYQEPLARFRREQIQDTVVFFGSARFQDEDAARKSLMNADLKPSGQREEEQRRARAAVDMARY